MIDDKKIEKAANFHRFELIASRHGSTLGKPMQCSKEVIDAETDLIEDSFTTGAKWAINEFLKDLWHDVDEIPKRAKAFIFECGDYSMHYHVGMMFNPNDYKKNAEIWLMNRWCYLEDILPKQEGGNQ